MIKHKRLDSHHQERAAQFPTQIDSEKYAVKPPNRDFLGVELEEMPHDEFNGGFVDVIVFTAIGEMGQSAERLINGGHFKRRNGILGRNRTIASMSNHQRTIELE